MSVLLARRLGLETVAVETFAGLDGQGKPDYQGPTDIEARVKVADEVAIAADGTEIRSALTLWVPADAALIPGHQDRITYEGDRYIGVERVEVKWLGGAVSHIRLRCREE